MTAVSYTHLSPTTRSHHIGSTVRDATTVPARPHKVVYTARKYTATHGRTGRTSGWMDGGWVDLWVANDPVGAPGRTSLYLLLYVVLESSAARSVYFLGTRETEMSVSFNHNPDVEGSSKKSRHKNFPPRRVKKRRNYSILQKCFWHCLKSFKCVNIWM